MEDLDNIKPDVIIDYFYNKDSDLPIIVIYVRPESNEVYYEKTLLKGVMPFGSVVYLANLNGRIFLKYALIIEHYAIQYRFAIYGKSEIIKYPEMIRKFERHFKVKFENAKIIGAFDAIIQLNTTAENLFDYIVKDEDFLVFYGQTIKRIGDYYIVNSNIPAILNKYTPEKNIFVMAIQLNSKECKIRDINHSIFEEIKKNERTTLIDEDVLKDIKWEEKIKRTYHISRNHIMATFDMIDFIFKGNGEKIRFDETPLGRIILERKILEEKDLLRLKENPLVYIKQNSRKKLINIVEEAKDRTMEECLNLISSIIQIN